MKGHKVDGDHLRRLRRKKFLSLRALAAEANVGLQTVLEVENNRRLVYSRTLFRLAKALDVEPAELVVAEDEAA